MRHLGLIAGVALLVVAAVAAVFYFGGTVSLPAGTAPSPGSSPTELGLDSRSRARLPVRIPFAAIATLANEGMARRFEGEKDDPVPRPQVTDDSLGWKVDRGDVAVGGDGAGRGRRLKVTAPLSGTARLRATIDLGRREEGGGGSRAGRLLGLLGIPAFKVDVSGDLAGTLTVRSAPEVRADYTILPHLDTDVRITKAEVPIRRLGRVDVRAPVQLAIDRSRERLVAEAEKRIAASDALRRALARQWEKMFVVRQVRDDPVTWLVVTPTALEAAQPVVAADALVLGVGVRAETRVVVSAEAPANPVRPLPEKLVLIDEVADGGFALDLPVSLSWGEINAVANDPRSRNRTRLKIAELAARHDLELERIVLQPSGNSVLLTLDVRTRSGGLFGRKMVGTLYLVARPVMRPGTDILVFEDLNHHVATKDLVAGAAAWLVSGSTLRALASGLAIDLEPALDKSAERARAQIAKSLARLPAGVSVSIGLDRVTVKRVAVSRDHLHVVMGATGTIGPVDIDLAR